MGKKVRVKVCTMEHELEFMISTLATGECIFDQVFLLYRSVFLTLFSLMA